MTTKTAGTAFHVRPERAEDAEAIGVLLRRAFGGASEARLVGRVREADLLRVALVAVPDDRSTAIVGHVLFTPVLIPTRARTRLMGLAPLAVDEAWRRRGVGTALVRAGFDACGGLDIDAVSVLGDPAYHERFGFTPAAERGIDCEYDVPDDVFRLVELRPGSLDGVTGTLFHDEAFAVLEEEA